VLPITGSTAGDRKPKLNPSPSPSPNPNPNPSPNPNPNPNPNPDPNPNPNPNPDPNPNPSPDPNSNPNPNPDHRPCIATCDNPAKDGRGLITAVWAGNGRPECLFPGTTVLVETEAR
jgi:hypothetical protein